MVMGVAAAVEQCIGSKTKWFVMVVGSTLKRESIEGKVADLWIITTMDHLIFLMNKTGALEP